MTCVKCNDTGFEIIERNGTSSARRCVCRPIPQPPDPGKTPLSPESATAGARVLMEYFAFAPKGDSAETMLANGLMNICSTVEQLNWLIPRACELYTTWGGKSGCGLPGLRQILGSKFTPKDGQYLLSTEAYPDGVPPERQLPEPTNAFRALPSGHEVSAAPSIERAIQDAANAKNMATYKPFHRPIAGGIITKPVKPVTQADIDAAVQELRRQKSAELDHAAKELIGAQANSQPGGKER